MLQRSRSILRVAPEYQPIFRELGIDAEQMFEHPLIKPWRKLADRENCTLDAALHDGRKIRWHIKRYEAAAGNTSIADDEVTGHTALAIENIPTAKLVGWGHLIDRRCFTIWEDLTDFQDAEKLVASGISFDRLLEPTADLAAKLHRAGLHHRDLYLCHFFAKVDENSVDVRLIDTARVKRLPGMFTRSRWIVKDLAQFWYSTTKLPIRDEQRTGWLKRYCEQNGLLSLIALLRKIERKSAWIARHDARLNRQQPGRNVSIPSGRDA